MASTATSKGMMGDFVAQTQERKFAASRIGNPSRKQEVGRDGDN